MAVEKDTEKPEPKQGTVVDFNEKRGMGYISSDEDGDDNLYVVRQPNIDLPGYAVLEVGQFVEFDLPDDAPAPGSTADIEVENVRPIELE